MKTMFDMDNPFFSFMGKVADYVILNLLFLITSCPVITIGPALCAMHEVLPKMAEGTEGSLYRTYTQAFIRKFSGAVRIWIPLLLAGAVLVFDVTVAGDVLGADFQKIMMPVVGSLLVFWMLIFSWIFLLPDGTGSGLKNGLKGALFAAVKNLPRSLLMIVIELIPAAGYLFFMRIFLGIILPFYVCIGFSLSGALCSILAGRTRIRTGHITT